MLITNINQLGDRALNPEESVSKLREENDALLESRRIHRQAELSDPDRSAGPRMYCNELINRLKKCNHRLLFRDGTPGNIAVYAPKLRGEDDEYDPTKPAWWNDHRYVGGFAADWLPEYSHVETDERNLPTREVRGWRSVLLGLLKAGAIDLKSANKHFGEAVGPRSWSWNQQISQLKERIA